MTISLDQQIACVRRELAMRKNVYPKWVANGRMKQEAAEKEMAHLQAVHDTLTAQKPGLVDATVATAWQDLMGKGDRNSPAEYPDMCLISQAELAEFMRRSIPPEAAALLAQIKDLKERLTLAGVYLRKIKDNAKTWGPEACAAHAFLALGNAIHPN